MKFSWVPMMFAAGTLCLAADATVGEPHYNATSAVDVKGVVTAVAVVPAGKPMAGVHATIKTKTETVDVYLAPAAFLNLLKMDVAVGDELRVLGSRVNDCILTKEFYKKGTSIVLRDPNGSPVWQNWGVEASVPVGI